LWQGLVETGYSCSLLNPTSTVYFRRMSLTKHKTDALDAVCIARYLSTVRPEQRGLNTQAQEQVRSLARAQATTAEQITQTVNRLHKYLDLSFPEYPVLVGHCKIGRKVGQRKNKKGSVPFLLSQAES